ITDSTGYFKFTFEDKNGGEQSIRYVAGAGYNVALNGIIHKTNADDLVIYKFPTANIQVKLNVLNPYTVNDTLVIADYRTLTNLYIPGPLTSGVLYTAINFRPIVMYYIGEPMRL